MITEMDIHLYPVESMNKGITLNLTQMLSQKLASFNPIQFHSMVFNTIEDKLASIAKY